MNEQGTTGKARTFYLPDWFHTTKATDVLHKRRVAERDMMRTTRGVARRCGMKQQTLTAHVAKIRAAARGDAAFRGGEAERKAAAMWIGEWDRTAPPLANDGFGAANEARRRLRQTLPAKAASTVERMGQYLRAVRQIESQA